MTSEQHTNEGLCRRIETLESALEAMTDEVRTRRLVVVDSDGHERITAYVDERFDEKSAEVKVASPKGDVNMTLYAGDHSYETAGWIFSRRGNTAAQAACDAGPEMTCYIDEGPLDVPASERASQAASRVG